MKAKRTLSALLTLLMLVSVLASLPVTANAADLTTGPMTLTYTNPAITVDVGTKVDLTQVSVQVNETTTLNAEDIAWTKDGAAVTSFTPDKKGVTTLVAKAGSTTKNVYVVAKNADETEYVLYENDFSANNLISDGWIVANNQAGSASKYTVSDGALHLGAKTDGQSRMMLPKWLGDFGDYAITMRASQTDIANDGRWSAMLFHVRDDGVYKEERHITIRANTPADTIEFSGMYNGGWEYPYKENEKDLIVSTSLNMTAGYHTLSLNLFGGSMAFALDGEQLLHVEKISELKGTNHVETTGLLGLVSDQGVLNVDSIKVTVMEQAPEKITPPSKLIDTSGNRSETNITSYVSNQAYAKDEAAFDALIAADKHPVAILLNVASDVTTAKFEKYLTDCRDNGIIPEFRLTSKTQVDAMSEAMANTGVPEVLVVSTDADVVAYARALKPAAIRAALEFTEKTMTKDQRFAAYQKTVGAGTQTIIIPYELATKENVLVLQNYQLAVWALGTGVDTATESAWLLASGANAVISDNWTAVADAQKTIFTAQNSLTRTPVYTAHRGYWAKAPENSMSAYIAAYESGVDCLETDVYISKDGRVFICHDGTLDRTTDGSGSIANMTYDQIKQYHLRMGSGGSTAITDETMPTLDEMLAYFKGKDVKIFCELKSEDAKLAPAVAKLVKQYGMEDQVVYISFSGNQIKNIKKELNTAANYLNISVPSALTDPIDVLNSYYTLQSAALAFNAVLGPSYGNINAEFIRDGGDRGMTYWTWTYTNGIRSTVNQMFLNGMNGLTTNDTPYLKTAVKTINAPGTLYAETGNTLSLNVKSKTYDKTVTDISKAVKITALDNDGVIAINSDGTITAKKNGEATVIASYEAKLAYNSTPYTLYTQPITIKVGPIEELTLNDDTFTLENGYLTGVTEKVAINTVLSAIANNQKVKIYNQSGKEVTDTTKYIGHGYTLEYNGKKTTVILKGDVNSNGTVDALDYMQVKRHANNTFTLTELQILAANVSAADDKVGRNGVGAYDYAQIKRHVNGTFSLFD